MATTEAAIHRRHVLTATAVFLAGCGSEGIVDAEDTPTPTVTDVTTPTVTATPELGGWSVHFTYDGDWQGTVSITTADGDAHQAFDGEGAKTVNVEAQLGVDTEDVLDIVVTAQKQTSDDQPLRVTIRKEGDIVAEGATDEPRGQVMVSHHE